MKKLHIGCGRKYKEGWVNLDISKGVKADVYHDIEKRLPFKDNTFDRVCAHNVLEHVNNPLKVCEEIWRVLKHNGVFNVGCPFAGHIESYQLNHKRLLTPRCFVIITKGHKTRIRNQHETKAEFKEKSMKLKMAGLHLKLPKVFQHMPLAEKVFNSFRGELIAIKK